MWILSYEQGTSYLKDCPQRRVVLMQSSVKLVGSLHHSAARKAMVMSARQPANASAEV